MELCSLVVEGITLFVKYLNYQDSSLIHTTQSSKHNYISNFQ